MSNNKWKTIKKRKIYSTDSFTVYENQVIDPNGNRAIRNLIETVSSVIIIPKIKDGFYLVGQYRYASNNYSWEFPSGGIKKKELPLAAAKRELEEELGFYSNKWHLLGVFHPVNSLMKWDVYLFVALNIKKKIRPCKPNNYEKLKIKFITRKKLENMIKENRINDSFTQIVYLKYILWKNFIK